MFEFLTWFNFERSKYVEKCFEYFDTTGGDTIDFLEFMISVWNICTLKVDTLTNFTFVSSHWFSISLLVLSVEMINVRY